MTSDPEWEPGVQAYWDGAHERGSSCRLGPTAAIQYTEYFGQAGHFAQDLAAANSVLDIGPGLGRYLASLENKARHAIDVSGVSRDKARALGALAYAPGEITAVGTDLATCLSVIQHCNRDSVKVIFADAFRALRQGGHFYVNGVQAGAGTNDGDQWELLRRARFSHSLEVSSGIAEEAGFKVHGVHTHKVGSLHVWVLCLVKP